MKQFANFSNEITMVLESPGSWCEAMIDGLDPPGSCCEAIYILFPRNTHGFAFPKWLADFDDLSGVTHARAPEESADSWFEISRWLL